MVRTAGPTANIAGPSYSRIELGLRTKYCAFWSGRTGGAMVEIYSLSRFVTAKQDQRRQKTSRKGHGKAKVLTVGKERELVEEKRQKDEALANKRHDIML